MLALCLPQAVAQEAEAPAAQQIEGIVAVVNDDPISQSDVRERARMLLLSVGSQPTQEQLQRILAQALEQLIDEKLQLQEAAEYEVEIEQAEITNAIENLARGSGITRDALIGTLMQAGVNPTSLEAQTRADIAWRRIMNGLYGSRIRISDTQIESQLEQLRASSQKVQYQLSEIFLYNPVPEDADKVLEAAVSIREQIQAGAPFNLVAQRLSRASTAATGGDMGWVALDDLDPEQRDAVEATEWPGLTDPIVVPNGVYLMSVRQKREPAESTSIVDLTRITVKDGSEASLKAAIDEIDGCDGIDSVVASDANLDASELTDLNINDLGPEGKSMVASTSLNAPTDVFAQSGTLAVMYVCKRQDNVENLPNREQVKDRLFAKQLGMVAQRSLRNLRREATILRLQ